MQAAGRLIKEAKVRAILGPQNSEQARYVVKRGAMEENQVPVIWFPITGPSLLPPSSPSSIYSDKGLNCFQFRAIADVIKALGWQSIVPIYEKTEYGSHLLPCLTNVLKDMGVEMANVTAIASQVEGINSTLDKLKDMRTHVFLVHMSMYFGTELILSAGRKEMMGEGFAWILTQELSSLTYPQVNTKRELYNADLSSVLTNFNELVPLTRYMQGALGVRPRDPEKTKTRVEKETNFSKSFKSRLTIYGWWAYHTIEALAMALEKPGSTDNGQTLRNEIEAFTFTGVSGVKFNLSQGQLDQSELEVYNVVGDSERIIGNWSPEEGLFQNQSSNKGGETAGEYKVKDPLWPGNTLDKPPKLRIGVPTKNSSPELVDADNSSERLTIDGFAKNVFLKALDVLPFRLNNYEFVPLPNMTYDDILCSKMKEKDLDAIIGDITIVANRTNCADFTFPYLDSSVAMVVRVMDASTNKLILVKPFNGLLWLLFCLIFAVATTIIILFLQINETRNRTNQTGGGDETGGGNGTSLSGGGNETNGGNRTNQTGAGSRNGGGNGTSQTGGGNRTSQTGAGNGTSQTGEGNGTSQTGAGNRTNGGNGTSQTGEGNEINQTGGGNGASQTGEGNSASQTDAGNGNSQTGAGNRTRGGKGTIQTGVGNGTSQTGAGNRTSQSGAGNGTSQIGEAKGASQTDVGNRTSQIGAGNGTSQVSAGNRTGGGNGTSQTGVGNGTNQTGGGNGASQTGGGNGTNQTGEGNGTNQTGEGNRNNQTDGEYRFNPFLVYKMDVMEINSTSKAAGWLVILTSFLFIFIVQVYTASLTSILNQGKTKEPLFMDEKELKSSNLSVGYQNGSWVRGLLIEQIGFNPSQLKGLGSREEYDEELSRGTQNGGVDAIFDETPHLTLFVSQYKPRFMMTGPIYQTGGFAFAFPKKSSLAPHFSNAILDVAHDVETYRVLMAKSSLPTSIEDLQLQDQK
ncbi:hypothetical protein QN277_025185 [Acacia crassicarpa]|uniref:Ionotropic glutamate receptor C-terminal domain-containing protein n=1 Tax=Acacia crassicarpa TaxID=499986 RepID=A0AAE1MKB0_9FABA|nr:hypothetical protein QN277_025185 [Acacia crassicarpa]